MKIQDFDGREPRFRLEEFFSGKTTAWGMFHDRFGRLKREFIVDIKGEFSDNLLILSEDFRFSDGATERRCWRIRKLDEHQYDGEADDVVGTARATAYGNAVHWTYDFRLKLGTSGLVAQFDDWMYLKDDRTVLNRARVTKFGLHLGDATIFFRKI